MNQWRISDCRLWNWSLVHWMKDTRTHLIIIISWNYLKWTEALSNSGYHDLFLYLSYLLVQHDVSCLSLFYQWSGPPPMFEVVPPPSTTQTPSWCFPPHYSDRVVCRAGSIHSLSPWPNWMFTVPQCSVPLLSSVLDRKRATSRASKCFVVPNN